MATPTKKTTSATKKTATKKTTTKATATKKTATKKTATKAAAATKTESKPARVRKTPTTGARKAAVASEVNSSQKAAAPMAPGRPLLKSGPARLAALPGPEVPHLRLIAQEPGTAYAAWALASTAGARRETLLLRLRRRDGTLIEEVALPSVVGHWYFRVDPTLTAEGLRAEIGSYDAAHRFKAVLQRDLERAVPYQPSATVDPRWSVTEERFVEMVERAGGAPETAAAAVRGWSSDLSSR